ncbi:MAG: FISUMP domain-containing protein [Patescibacteria group bacterium]
MLNSKKAFTLIELLVVIAIIGVLATVSIIAFSNARAKARDAKRVGDMKQVQTALELFINDNNRYPTTLEWNTGELYSTNTLSTTTYMRSIPNAPTPSDGDCTDNQNAINYIPNLNYSSYSISFCIGNTTGTLPPGPKCLTPEGISDIDCTPLACGTDQVTITSIGNYTCGAGDLCVYDTIEVGTQCWLKQSLNIGNRINGANDQSDNSSLEKYCYDDNTTNCTVYGALYQWNEAMQYSAVEGSQGICPSGWHIPTDAEQNTLDQYLTDTTCDEARSNAWSCSDAGGKLKEAGTSHWVSPNTGATNSFGFTALASGDRTVVDSFYGLGSYAGFWSSSVDDTNSFGRMLRSSDSTINRVGFYRTVGNSIRCLQD